MNMSKLKAAIKTIVSRFYRLQPLLFTIYMCLRLHLCAIWIKLNRYVTQPNFLLSSRYHSELKPSHSESRFLPSLFSTQNNALRESNLIPSFHKVVIIGDGLAMGIGGTTESGTAGVAGIAPYLQTLLTLEPSVRRPWRIINRGELYRGTTTQWLPPPDSYEESKTKKSFNINKLDKTGALYTRTFLDSNCRDADIVILLMGSADILSASVSSNLFPKRNTNAQDSMIPRKKLILPPKALERDLSCLNYPHDEISFIVKNIVTISLALQKKGKHVCIIDMPTTGFPNSKIAGRGIMRRLNSQLKQYLRDVNGLGSTKKRKENELHPIHLISLGNNHKIMRPEYRSFDGLYLNHKGYKALASEVFVNAIKPMMVISEWKKVWKVSLNNKHEKKIN